MITSTPEDAFGAIARKLRDALPGLPEKKTFVGFDGYIDRLMRLKRGQAGGYFDTMEDFSHHITKYAHQSLDIATQRVSQKIGGNGPLLAESLAHKHVAVACVGAMGLPTVESEYMALSQQCALYSVEAPAFSYVMEFTDGKVMLGESASLDRINYARVRDVLGEDTLRKMLDESDLFAFCNWSGLLHANDILSGLLREICPGLPKRARTIFFDLADPSGKSADQFTEFFGLMEALRPHFRVVLGLNPKETVITYNHFFQREETVMDESMAKKMRAAMPVDEIVLHANGYALAVTGEGAFRAEGTLLLNPTILTGGGDNFNAGYCLGLLIGCDPQLCAHLGNLSSRLYIQNGKPCDIDDIFRALST